MSSNANHFQYGNIDERKYAERSKIGKKRLLNKINNVKITFRLSSLSLFFLLKQNL